jgi:hypothetical protein
MKELACGLMVVVVIVGCGGGGAASSEQDVQFRVLTRLYTRVSTELGRPPKDEAEFKEKIKAVNPDLSAVGATSVDDLFVSDRDGQPVVVVYGQPLKGTDVVIYEKAGVDGKRLVGHKIGSVEEVEAAQFAELVPNAPE